MKKKEVTRSDAKTGSNAERAKRDFDAALDRAREGFAVHRTSPTDKTLLAVTVLEAWIGKGGSPRMGLSLKGLKALTRAIYQGLSSARTNESAVVLYSLPQPGLESL